MPMHKDPHLIQTTLIYATVHAVKASSFYRSLQGMLMLLQWQSFKHWHHRTKIQPLCLQRHAQRPTSIETESMYVSIAYFCPNRDNEASWNIFQDYVGMEILLNLNGQISQILYKDIIEPSSCRGLDANISSHTITFTHLNSTSSPLLEFEITKHITWHPK